MDRTETEIKRILDRVSAVNKARGGCYDSWWTGRIKRELCALGQRKRFGVSAAGCRGADTGEWLFDMAWSKGKGKGRTWVFHEMPLVMECEWSLDPGDISWDFEKLLVAKARYKVLIFQQRTRDDVSRLFSMFRRAIQHFRVRLPDERYLLAGFSIDEKSFQFEVVT